MLNKQEDNTSGKIIITAGIAVVLLVFGYYIWNAPDTRNTGEKLNDAINELPQGVEKASRQLENRTPGDKLGDAVEDAGTEIRKSTNQQ